MPRHEFHEASEDYRRVEKAIAFLEANQARQPSLDEVAAAVHLSPFHFNRMFQRWAGISPMRFLRFLTKEHAAALLGRGASLLDASLESGLSGPGRLHDLMVACEAVTPGEWKRRGEGLAIRFGTAETPFGLCLAGLTARGICNLQFFGALTAREAEALMREEWPAAELVRDDGAAAAVAERIFAGRRAGEPLALHLHGTNFQIKVWQALLAIPSGSLVTYQEVGRAIGQPNAGRAIGSAVGANPVSLLVPCHRVIRKGGVFGNYRWGPLRKRAMVAWESARREPKEEIEKSHGCATG
jgi:AraC family transcriptional regulator of adaptative response/methylated-DNA-[protein]-cysteine methyltransferase